MKKTWKEFLAAKGLTEETLKEKGAEDVAGLFNEYNEEVRKAQAEAIEAKASKEDLDKFDDSEH